MDGFVTAREAAVDSAVVPDAELESMSELIEFLRMR